MRPTHVAMFLSLALHAGCGGTYVDLAAGTKAPSGISLNVDALEESPNGIKVQLVLRNESRQVFTYTGYSQSAPRYFSQFFSGVAWLQRIEIMCGTGLREIALRPGQQVTFTAGVYAPNRLRRVRIGIASTDATFMVWSPIIDPATLKVGVAAR